MPPPITPAAFIAKWQRVTLPERAASQEHFIDLCRLLGQPTPAEHDATGAEYTFEKGVSDLGGPASAGSRGERGFADVWWRGKFAWEYKRKEKYRDLTEAYRQLCQYREALDNPPLLIVSDIARTEIHTNFTGTRKEVHALPLADLDQPENLDKLRRVFTDPESFKPTLTTATITEEAAAQFAHVAAGLRDRGHDAHQAAHFLMKCMFCLFAEDVGLLPRGIMKRLLKRDQYQPEKLTPRLTELFRVMRTGGDFGADEIAFFNGGLFDDAPALELRAGEVGAMLTAAEHDWGAVEPAIFGTLFERSLDPGKRAQIGAHYTSRQDIMLIVEPVVMAPLRREWQGVRADVEALLEKRRKATTKPAKKKADDAIAKRLDEFLHRLGSIRILDPACGSGNFLYVAIQQLLDLEKQVVTFAARTDIGLNLLPRVRPTQLHGIEINAYAAELAQVVIWIGYLQWMRDNGFVPPSDPILEPLQTIECRDAILDWAGTWAGTEACPTTKVGQASPPAESEVGQASLPARAATWPEADFIIGNPPFLGSKLFRQQGLDDAYVQAMYDAFDLPKTSDLCCYWFELARRAISGAGVSAGLTPSGTGVSAGLTPSGTGVSAGPCKPGIPAGPGRHGGLPHSAHSVRVGLLATQGIRGGDNRTVLERIKQTGNIFMAWSDREWILDGAAVHVSMVGFDGGRECLRTLDTAQVTVINADLTAGVDSAGAVILRESLNIAYMGTTKGGSFDVEVDQARKLLSAPNPQGPSNANVVRPWINGADLTRRNRGMFIIDFGTNMGLPEAALYEAPFRCVEKEVKPERIKNRREAYAEKWWIHVEPRPALRDAIDLLPRFLVTCRVAKHRLFAWFRNPTLPDSATFAFARSDDYFFGVLHSSIHELWARRMGTQLREAESGFRYTPTTCFETFPLPWAPGTEPVAGRDAGPTSKVGQASLPAPQASPPPEVGPASPPVPAGTEACPTLADFNPPDFRRAVFEAYARHLPHWRVEGATYFLTWRLRSGRPDLSPEDRTLIAAALRHFDGQRYYLLAWVVMNDHVHVLVYPFPGRELKELTHSWKSYTANQMQRRFARRGRVWLDESFDRVVRDEHELFQKLYYILNNPFKRWPDLAQYEWVGLHAVLSDLGPVGAPIPVPPQYQEPPPSVGPASLPAPQASPPPEVGPASPPVPAGTEACPTEPSTRTAAQFAAYRRISDAARELNELRERWLNPPEWIGPLTAEIDAGDDFADAPPEARPLIRESAIMAAAAKDPQLKKRTLTNLYNERPTWLRLAHEKLDRAVLAAYAAIDTPGEWSEDWAQVWTDTGAGQPLPDDHPFTARRRDIDQRVLANLLRLNQQRAPAT